MENQLQNKKKIKLYVWLLILTLVIFVLISIFLKYQYAIFEINRTFELENTIGIVLLSISIVFISYKLFKNEKIKNYNLLSKLGLGILFIVFVFHFSLRHIVRSFILLANSNIYTQKQVFISGNIIEVYSTQSSKKQSFIIVQTDSELFKFGIENEKIMYYKVNQHFAKDLQVGSLGILYNYAN